MKTRTNQRILALMTVLATAACAESDTEVLLDDLTPEEAVELEVLSDPGSFEIALELSESQLSVAAGMGHDRASVGSSLNVQARALFGEARGLMLSGDRRQALNAARQARRLVAEALREIGGDASLEALIERIEALAETVDPEVFDDPEAVRAALERLAAEARELLAEGKTVEAAARALLGEQLARFHRGHRDRPDIDVQRARLAVSLAHTAIGLAERLIADGDVPTMDAAATVEHDRRNRWLAHAKRLLARAETALENGHLRRAVHLAQYANWSALGAVILPGGIEREELRALVSVAQRLLAEAEASLGDDATELELRLFNHAVERLERGIAMLEEGRVRGIAPVWRSAVVSAWLLR